MPSEEEVMLMKKVQFFYDTKAPCHITTKKKDQFYNGHVLEIGADFFFFRDKVLGKILIFSLEVKDVRPYQKEGAA